MTFDLSESRAVEGYYTDALGRNRPVYAECAKGHPYGPPNPRTGKRKCSICQRVWYERNRERMSTAMREYYRTHSEHIRQRTAAYRQEHPEEPGTKSARSRSYYLRKKTESPTHYAEKRARRRALESRPVDLGYVWARDFGLCHICGNGVDRADAEFDHVIPLSRGGAHHEDNLRVAHRRCNRSKGARLLGEMA